MALAVNSPNDEISALRQQWMPLQALDGGTPAMRKATTALLPRWPGEESDAYNARVGVATLFPAWRRTVNVMSGKPFSQALQLTEMDPRIEAWAQNVDLQGVSLHSFSAEMFREVVGYGLAGILVDSPKASASGRQTVAQAEAEGRRPYWVRVRHDQILGWKAALQGGAMRLTQLRLLECHEEDDGPYGVKVVPQVRVLVPGGWSIYRQAESSSNAGKRGDWVLVESGTTSLSDIPFVPLYGVRKAFMVGEPPLLDLGYLNIKHWQSQSDQDTILHVARVPILAMYGVDADTQLVVGASTAVRFTEPKTAAGLEFVEHTGAAINAGAESLKDLEQQMIQSGAELLVKQPGDRSATESANDAEANKSDLQRMAENFEDALDQALVFTAQFAGIDVARAGSVTLYSGYGEATLGDASATLVKDLMLAGVISRETGIAELKRRGELAQEVDPAVEAARIAEEGPLPGAMSDGGADPNADPLAA
ncbi:MAG: DUF4055 domain-containing protein [Pseudoxanthomonas sp.]|nr:DUF4055 domain-containing protein [Pseudoxanthomonas sp.]